ncbi:glycosyltransferase [Arthrobacter rhombi]|uniref:glycosyltransferase n=1 Tax=Arthrobacter rhombi TaxID=71253 RepID=UPI003FD199BA
MNIGGWVLDRIDDYQRSKDIKWRVPPKFHVYPENAAPAVYYLAPEEPAASGGIKVIYRHVDVLVSLGIVSAVVHPREGFRASWFSNETPVIPASDLQLRSNDILVVPECYAPGFEHLPTNVRIVVFNQGPHHTFDRIGLDPERPGAPYSQLPNLAAVLTVSNDGAELLRMTFPDTPVWTVRNVVDESVFYPIPERPRRNVAYVPSRRPDELSQLLHLLNARREFSTGEWSLTGLSGLTEIEMANALRRSSIFLSLSHRDGFGLPPAEAMACGAYVIGHPGGGGTEFFDPAYCSPAHDNTQIMRALLDTMSMPREQLQISGAKASASVLSHYSAEGLRTDLDAFYSGLLR